jgi:hypothetical protein
MKAFPQILKVRRQLINAGYVMLRIPSQVLYNKDCVSDQAIIYWHQKGSKPQGRQHFLKATEGLVKVQYIYGCPNGFSPFLTHRPVFAGTGRQRGRVNRPQGVFLRSRVAVFLQIGGSDHSELYARLFSHVSMRQDFIKKQSCACGIPPHGPSSHTYGTPITCSRGAEEEMTRSPTPQVTLHCQSQIFIYFRIKTNKLFRALR